MIDLSSNLHTLTLHGCCLDSSTSFIKIIKFAQLLVNHPSLKYLSLIENQLGKSICTILLNIMSVIIDENKLVYTLQHIDFSNSRVNDYEVHSIAKQLNNKWSQASRNSHFLNSLKIHGIYSLDSTYNLSYIFSPVISNINFDYIKCIDNYSAEYI